MIARVGVGGMGMARGCVCVGDVGMIVIALVAWICE
jgi:hypothetical protein